MMPSARVVDTGTDGDGRAISLSTHLAGDGPPVVFCHGFPDLAFGWRHQLDTVAAAGFQAIAPDQRGYGSSSRPDEIEAYGLTELTGDLVRLLDALGHDDAVFVGHDWGGFVVWAMAVLHPQRVRGVAGVCTPYLALPPVARHLEAVDGDAERQYVAWFQTDGVAETVMDANAEMVMAKTMRSAAPAEDLLAAGFADGKLNMNPFIDADAWPWLGEAIDGPDVLAHYVEVFERTGFRGGINWYRNIDRNLADHPDIGKVTLDIPCLMLTAELDPGLRPEFAEPMHELCGDLTMHHLKGVAHWVHQERPDEVNQLLLAWLERFR